MWVQCGKGRGVRKALSAYQEGTSHETGLQYLILTLETSFLSRWPWPVQWRAVKTCGRACCMDGLRDMTSIDTLEVLNLAKSSSR